mgnify:FL=1
MTKFLLKVLSEIAKRQPVRATELAKAVLPYSHMHGRSYNTGNGACKGKGAWLWIGSYVGKLRQKELVHGSWVEGYQLTDKGKAELAKKAK